jgi:membrane protein YdbS with pleckstrin-like domain
VPELVETHDPEGVDYGWVMQVTFVLTILVGAPIVAVVSVGADLPTWGARAEFAVRIGAVVWILTALPTFLYARRRARERTVGERERRESDDAPTPDPAED